MPQGDQDSDYYRLTQWSSIDTFVYFSHALVTIPPPGWINAAHSNAVPVSHLQAFPYTQILATCRTRTSVHTVDMSAAMTAIDDFVTVIARTACAVNASNSQKALP